APAGRRRRGDGLPVRPRPAGRAPRRPRRAWVAAGPRAALPPPRARPVPVRLHVLAAQPAVGPGRRAQAGAGGGALPQGAMSRAELQRVTKEIVRCTKCPRLVAWREEAARLK